MPCFVAIDFETSHNASDSACAVALVRVQDGAITARRRQLLRPPLREMLHTRIHGITWADVRDQPTFAEAWPDLSPILEGAQVLAAHYAPFDRAVLQACCDRAGLARPTLPWLCTVKLARRAFRIYPTRLPDVARELSIPLNHHEPLSDAEACARIAMRAWGWVPQVLRAA